MRKMLIFLLVFAGCQAPPKIKYTFETSSPDVWASEPKQTVTAKVEITH